MNRKEFVTSIKNSYAAAVGIVASKNDDYAKGDDPFKNFRYSEVIDVTVEKAILVRVLDKIARIDNVIEKGEVKVKSETVTDTILDVINYMAILKAYIDAQE